MKLNLFAATAATIFIGAAANAATITPVAADCDAGVANSPVYDASIMCGGAGRSDASAVNLGAPDGDFYSLGIDLVDGQGGAAIFEIDPMFTGPAVTVEVTYTPSPHAEAARVFVLLADAFGAPDIGSRQAVGVVHNGEGGLTAPQTTVNFTGYWNFIAFQDISKQYYPNTASTDGFDIDSVSVTTVPLPAGVLLLGGAVAGLGALRRRKAQG